MSVAEAAEMLGVHSQRVHQRIREGSLAAEKIGNQWAIERDELRGMRHHAGPGRPLSAKSAWDLLAVAASDEASSGLSPSARSRARSRLRNLLVHGSSADLEEGAAHIVKALRNRAERALFAASPRDLPDLRKDNRLHLSGVSLHESGLSFGDVAEGYVSSDNLNPLVDDYLLSPAARSRANVILHVVPSDPANPLHEALDDVARSPLALAADLAEHDGIREKSQAIRCLGELNSRFVARAAGVVGATRG
ncbi:MAG TPA: helix-turn-helix domain-containing protein [Intrasporangium sp.]|uniref:helix-turn-helix domain-containing protein n=1 Tax=Intrasporangium sp. TaxID=1925024 RepID=UPI002D795E35|nr:helix-turn-helix domain-containing protein [Intrasporangium sp.]HET7397536.1 helix-turn-helix domain-containing protein [Intrasporangium sp.]